MATRKSTASKKRSKPASQGGSKREGGGRSGEYTSLEERSLGSYDEQLVEKAFQGAPAVKRLSPAVAQKAARTLMGKAKGADLIDQAMRKRGLLSVNARAKGYSAFSEKTSLAKTLAIVPYNAPDPKSKLIGGVGMSDGEPASGVIVELRGTQVVSFTTLDLVAGRLVEYKHSTSDLGQKGGKALVEAQQRNPDFEADIDQDTTTTVSIDTFQQLLTDEYSSKVYTQEDIRNLIHNVPIVSAIAELQHMRLKGMNHSPDVSCCCCCCCCWGSCSSCSAVTTRYVNEKYNQWAAQK